MCYALCALWDCAAVMRRVIERRRDGDADGVREKSRRAGDADKEQIVSRIVTVRSYHDRGQRACRCSRLTLTTGPETPVRTKHAPGTSTHPKGPESTPGRKARKVPRDADTWKRTGRGWSEYCHPHPPPASSPQGLCGLLYERLVQTNMLGALAPLPRRDLVQLFAA